MDQDDAFIEWGLASTVVVLALIWGVLYSLLLICAVIDVVTLISAGAFGVAIVSTLIPIGQLIAIGVAAAFVRRKRGNFRVVASVLLSVLIPIDIAALLVYAVLFVI